MKRCTVSNAAVICLFTRTVCFDIVVVLQVRQFYDVTVICCPRRRYPTKRRAVIAI